MQLTKSRRLKLAAARLIETQRGAPPDRKIFESFRVVAPKAPVEGYEIFFLGQRQRLEFTGAKRATVRNRYPYPNDETFEYIALLKSVLQCRGSFTMIELGAGFGRWLVNAALALRQKCPDISPQLIGVEAEPTHFEWMGRHLADNGVSARTIKAAITDKPGKTHFIVGEPEQWYGQAIVPAGFVMQAFPEAVTVEVDAITLSSLLVDHKVVDLIDMDIQGTEADVIPEAIDEMNRRVRRVCVATHSAEIESKLSDVFSEAGWQCEANYRLGQTEDTPFGKIDFRDGCQVWRNPTKFLPFS